jgi:hypothetical protein
MSGGISDFGSVAATPLNSLPYLTTCTTAPSTDFTNFASKKVRVTELTTQMLSKNPHLQGLQSGATNNLSDSSMSFVTVPHTAERANNFQQPRK